LQPDRQNEKKQFIPALTIVACAACIIIFIGLGQQSSDLWRQTEEWGYLSPERIYRGAYWGLISSVFVHREIWHIALNLYWLWFLGGAMEHSVGSMKYAVFFLSAAFVSSSLQMAFGGAGIGMSGVGYAIFGFGWMARDRYPELRRIVTPQVINLFLIWMVACIPATMLGIMNVGNAAHIAGLLFGVAVGALFVLRWKPFVSGFALFTLFAASIATLFWAPWSMDWNAHRGLSAHNAVNYPEAIRSYHRALELGEDPKWAWRNLAEIYGSQQDRPRYAEAMRKLQELDPGSAKELEAMFGPAEGSAVAVPSPK
jgi:membrane associated rhomboid family serine protease